MCQRKQLGLVLLLTTGLASSDSGPLPARNPPPGGEKPRVIATSGEGELPRRDDGSSAPLGIDAAFGAAGIQRVGYQTDRPKPTLSLSIDGPKRLLLGGKVSFQIRVGNPTSVPIANVNLRSLLSAGLVHPEGGEITAELDEPLMPGQVRSFPLEVLVRAVDRQQVCVTATAAGHRVQAGWGHSSGDPRLFLVPRGPRQANLDQPVTFRLEVSNLGQAVVAPVKVRQGLPEGLALTSASRAGSFEGATRSIVWDLASLQPGEMQTLTFTAQARKPGDWALPCFATGGVAETRGTHSVRIDPPPSSSLTLRTRDDRLPIGGETTCDARVFNQGPNPMRDTFVVFRLPEGLGLVTAEGPTRWQQRDSQVVFEPMTELGPRVDAIYRLRLRAVSEADVAIRAELYSAGLSDPRQAFRSILIEATPPPR